jgi:hypothetical protein
MIFDGMRWRRTKKVVNLPYGYTNDELGYPESRSNYLSFGRICDKDTEGAVKTSWYYKEWDYDKEEEITTPIYAKPIKCNGHSRTNMMFGADGYMYLFTGREVYIRSTK